MFKILIPILLLSSASAKMEVSYKEGEALGKSSAPALNEGELKSVSGFQTDNPREVSFFESPAGLSDPATSLLHEDGGSGQMLVEIEQNRGNIVLDPETDPLFTMSDRIVSNPLESLKATREKGEGRSHASTQVCYESGEPQMHQCKMYRTAELKPIPQKILKLQLRIPMHSRDPANGGPRVAIYDFLTKQHQGIPIISVVGEDFDTRLKDRTKSITLNSFNYWVEGDFDRHAFNASLNGTTVTAHGISHVRYKKLRCGKKKQEAWLWYRSDINIDIDHKPLPTEDDLIEVVEDGCAPFERMCDDGRCHYGKENIIEGAATRVLDTLEVKRPWWHKERTYYCGTPSKNDCGGLRKRGCFQTNSECHRKERGMCLEWKQTFQCPASVGRRSQTHLKAEDLPFGLDGSQVDQTWKSNTDMTEVLAKLSLLKEIQQEKTLMNNGTVFRGNGLACSKHCINFSDCCSLSSGWGESLKLTSCSANEKLLGRLRKEGKCHLVGTYCAEKEKITKICLKKKTTFCCYDSKLARTIQEQGRAQLGISWGPPDAANCRALSIAEFSAINFDRINFSEIYQDILSKVKIPDTNKIVQNFQQNWKKRLPSTADLKKTDSMQDQAMERRRQILTQQPGSHTLHEVPPPKETREELQPQLVF